VEKHRVLIFTQMTKMLDVLERFLNYHGHVYLRLDGTTRVEQRQALMERFNEDTRIFCFILSTRSGGIGVNLTGADTVIFYDSDWNPTMDAQAQDRCHRIGQTRDVHIYRLISERTVEENILKKANQKRLLGDIAIEGGNFTTAFFKQTTILDLFEMESGKEAAMASKGESSSATADDPATQAKVQQSLYEQALLKAEDEQDAEAATKAQAEQAAELAEFNESIPYDQDSKEVSIIDEETAKVEMELTTLHNQLTPIEKYAVRYLEGTGAFLSRQDTSLTEAEVELAKKDWELGHIQALKEEEERRAAEEEDEIFFTYSQEESVQVKKSKKSSSRKSRSAKRSNPSSKAGSRSSSKSRTSETSKTRPSRSRRKRNSSASRSRSASCGSDVSRSSKSSKSKQG